MTRTFDEEAVTTAPDIAALRAQIDRLDADIVCLVRRRSAISRELSAAQIAAGGTRVVHSREIAVLSHFRELGRAGTELGILLLRMGRDGLDCP